MSNHIYMYLIYDNHYLGAYLILRPGTRNRTIFEDSLAIIEGALFVDRAIIAGKAGCFLETG